MIGIEPIMIDKKNQETYQSFEPTRTAVKCAVCPCCQASFRFAIRSIGDKKKHAKLNIVTVEPSIDILRPFFDVAPVVTNCKTL